MSRLRQLIEQLRARSDVEVHDEESSWQIIIPKESDLICEVLVPYEVLEWYASVKRRHEDKELWQDWMDYCGYDDTPKDKLEANMANDILAFVNRVLNSQKLLPIEIYEDEI